MIRWRKTAQVSIAAIGLAMALAGLAWAGAPGYYCTELVGLSDSGSLGATNAYGETLLSNGTVIGESVTLPADCLMSWANSGAMPTWGAMTEIYAGTPTPGGGNLMEVENIFGDADGRVGVAKSSGISLYSGGTLSPISQLQGSVLLTGMSQNGLMAGYWNSGSGTAFAYDAATKSYYTIGPAAGSWAQGVNGACVVGGDGTNLDGFVWNETNQSYVQIPGLAAAQGISSNAQFVAGLTQGPAPSAAVYIPSGSSYNLQATYWSGEATGVNDNGVVIGDTAASYYNGGPGTNWQGHAMAYVPGYDDPRGFDLNAYAPTGVTFNVAQAVNDAGQILVWSNGWSEDPTDGNYNCESYLLTPALPGDANLDGKVDVNDLTIVLSHFGQTGTSWSTGDFVGDGTVDVNDLTIVLAHFGQSPGAGNVSAVPEPGTLLLLTAALVGLLGYPHRKP
jgi:hypothetical protein